MINVKEVEIFEKFIKERDKRTNVYRTGYYIVFQTIVLRPNLLGQIELLSHDVFFLRTPEREEAYERCFTVDGITYEGKRIKTRYSGRDYPDGGFI